MRLADGYTLLMSTNALVITPHLKALPYKPLEDFEPITIVGQEYHHLLVTPKLPVKTVKEFIDLAKSTPGGLTFSSAGPGSAPFLGMQRFMQASGMTEYGPRSISRFDAGRHGAGHSRMFNRCFPRRRRRCRCPSEGKIRVLAVSGPRRDPNVPDVPTMAESGSAGFRKQHLVRPDGAVQGAARTSWPRSGRTWLRRCARLWCSAHQRSIKSIPVGNTSEEFRKVILSDYEIFERVIANAK